MLNRRELPPLTTDLVSIDHRRGPAFAPGEGVQYLQAGIDLDQDIRTYVEVVHVLSDLGAVCTHVGHGSSREGFDAEWRGIDLLTVEGDSVNRCEVFEETDLDAALAKFEQLSRPAPFPQNTASQVGQRYREHFAAGDWDAMAATIADDFFGDDRRRVVGSGVRIGREAQHADMRAIADLFIADMMWTDIATRGDRLVLFRVGFLDRDQKPDAFHTEVLCVAEIDTEERIVASISFDLDDVDAAFEELDTRYLAGEAAEHAHTWSVIADACIALNRREQFATTPDWVNIDHRKGIAFTPGDLTAYVRSAWNLLSDGRVYIETAHRLTNLGAVVTWAGHAKSQEGADVEFRGINVLTIEGDLISRCEIFDEADLDAALALFDELQPRAPRLENAASQVAERFLAHFATGGWDGMADILADDFTNDDRRRVVGAGLRHGRDREMADMRTVADLWATNVTSTVIATRAKHLALLRLCFLGHEQGPERFLTELFTIIEINADEHVVSVVSFDLDDIDAVFEELDARYLAGEAADHARTWSVIAETYAAYNRHELPAEDWRIIDHRTVVGVPSESAAEIISSVWDLAPDLSVRIEAVHRLSGVGAVITLKAYGTSTEGFAAEWRMIQLPIVEGDRHVSCEVFDEADLDVALARFEELQPQAPQLENAASRLMERVQADFAARNWAAIAENSADEIFTDDRRSVVGSGILGGRDLDIANMRAAAELGSANFAATVIATRGERLILIRLRMSGRDERPDAFHSEMLGIVEIDADHRVAARILFDLNDIDAAFEELDHRYLEGEAAEHARTWSVIAEVIAMFNRHELPARDWHVMDHRPLVGDPLVTATAIMNSIWDLAPDFTMQIEAVHRLSALGAVIAVTAYGTAAEGLAAEWRMIQLPVVEGDRVDCCEIFDEADLDAAIARFEELHEQAPRLENAATRVGDRLRACLAADDWAGISAIAAQDIVTDDRRAIIGAGFQRGQDVNLASLRASFEIGIENVAAPVIAIRGDRLALDRLRYSGRGEGPEPFYSEMLRVLEIDAEHRITAGVYFDVNDVDAAFEELDARYLAGEAAAHAHTWSVIAELYAGFNRHERPATTRDFIYLTTGRS